MFISQYIRIYIHTILSQQNSVEPHTHFPPLFLDKMTSTTSISTNHTTTSTTNSANSAPNSTGFEPRRANNAKPTVSQKSQYWCLTLPHYTEQEYHDIASLVEKQIADFIIIGKEICPTTQTPHFHAYI